MTTLGEHTLGSWSPVGDHLGASSAEVARWRARWAGRRVSDPGLAQDLD
jgi:hypothetical protein